MLYITLQINTIAIRQARGDLMIELKAIRKVEEKNKMLDGVDLFVQEGSIVVIVSKKTEVRQMLLDVIGGKKEVTSGEVFINHVRVKRWDQEALHKQISFAEDEMKLLPFFTTIQNMRTAMGYTGNQKKNMDQQCIELLRLVGLNPDHYGQYYPYKLSSEEKHCLYLAKILIKNPSIIIMDQPFLECSSSTRHKLYQMLFKINRTMQKTIVIGVEELEEALGEADAIYTIKQGKLNSYTKK